MNSTARLTVVGIAAAKNPARDPVGEALANAGLSMSEYVPVVPMRPEGGGCARPLADALASACDALRNLAVPAAVLTDEGAAVVFANGDAGWPQVYAEVLAGVHAAGPPGLAATEALQVAGIRPSDVDYLHAEGHTAQDLAALGGAYARLGEHDRHACLIGATGRACLGALADVLGALYEAWLPAPPAHFMETVIEASLTGSVLALAGHDQPWLPCTLGGRRIAAVSALSAGGASHVVLVGRSTAAQRTPVTWDRGGPFLLPISAPDGERLARTAVVLRHRLDSGVDPRVLMHEAVAAFERDRCRAVIVGTDATILRRELATAELDLPAVLRTGRDWVTLVGSFASGKAITGGRVAFVYPGTFATYAGAGEDLFRLFPGLRAQYEKQTPNPAERFGLRTVFPRGLTRWDAAARERHTASLVADVGVMFTSGVNFAVLYTRLLRDVLRIRPDGGFGYSMGEISMLFAHEVWSAERADDAKIRDTPLFRHELYGRRTVVRAAWRVGDGIPDDRLWVTRVLLVDLPAVTTAMAGLDRVFVTHVNTPSELVVSGDPAQCSELARRLGCPVVELPAAPVLHCSLVDSVVDRLIALNQHPPGVPDPQLELVTAYDNNGYPLSNRDGVARRVGEILRGRVDFVQLVRAAHAKGFRYFIEVGPGATCTRWIDAILNGAEHVAVPVDRQGSPGALALARALARLIGSGLDVDLVSLLTAESPPPAADPVAAGEGERQIHPAGSISPATDEELIIIEGEPFNLTRAVPGSAPLARVAVPAVPAPQSPMLPVSIELSGALGAVGTVVARAHHCALRAQATMLEYDLREVENTVRVAAPPVLPAGQPHGNGLDNEVIWNYDDLMEFATGSVAKVFGAGFAAVDQRARRVRLPAPPYLFASRVTELDAQTGVFEPCSITVEYDVPHDAWFAVDGRAPFAVIFEVGQASLLLLSYLGIDLDNPDNRVYRLLGGSAIFHGRLPGCGQTLRYLVNINQFVWMDRKLLLFFSYRCFHGDELVLEMVDGCAGFFTRAELEAPLGTADDDFGAPRPIDVPRRRFTPLAHSQRSTLNRCDLDMLARGQAAQVFGSAWDQRVDGCNPSVRLPAGDMLFLDEITSIDRYGGPAGLGELTAVKHITADDWYFACHFTDDPVLPGSLTIEGAAQLIEVYAIYLGLHLVLPDAELQPVPELRCEVKLRGQITPGDHDLCYVARITEISLIDRPTIIADITAYAGDKQIVIVRNFGVQLREKPGSAYGPERGGRPATFLGRRNPSGEPALLNELHLAHLARGDLVTAMGPEFEIYRGRRAPHLPGGDFQFVDRIMRVEGQRGTDPNGSVMVSEYDSPADAWYYEDNAFPTMPNCVLMETSLQAAVLTGYYLGATLVQQGEELAIRNLDGTASLVTDIDLRGRTIRHHSKILFTQHLAGVSLQNFQYELTADGQVFYRGESLFGYFNDAALAAQAGLDGGEYVAPWLDRESGIDPARVYRLPVSADGMWFRPQLGSGLRLASGHLRLVDHIDVVLDGGDHGLGYLRGEHHIDPDSWYLACHFFQDPVMPGSLGVEAVLQGLQAFVLHARISDGMGPVTFALPIDRPTTWKYRGQILPTDQKMVFDLHIKQIHDVGDKRVIICDANVFKPGMRIYELHDLAIEIRPATDSPAGAGIRRSEQ